MKIKIKLFCFIISCLMVCGGIFYFPVEIKALETDVKINEVVCSPTDGVEWVELFNAGPDDIDLNDWVLTDEDGVEEYVFTNSVIFPANTFLVISSDSGTDDLDFSDNLGVIFADHGSDYAGTLDQLSLYNNSTTLDDSTIIDFMAYGGDAGSDDDNAIAAGIWKDGEYIDTPSSGNSLGLIIDGDDSNNLADWQEFDYPTYGLSNEYVNQAPNIVDMWVDPDPITADGSSYVLFSAEIDDPDGIGDIVLAEIDLFEIGGDANQELYDDGTNGDDVPGDGIYSFETTIPVLVPSGNYQLPISVFDSIDNSDIQDLSVEVDEIVYENNVRLNEVLPNPSGAETNDEYIEIYNNSITSVDLAGWYIKDASGTIYVIDPADFTSTIISSHGFFTIYRDVSGIALNNSGDEVEIYQPNDNLLDSVKYAESAPEDNSYSYKSSNWQWSTTMTPNQANVITSPNENPIANAGDDLSGEVNGQISFDGNDSSDPDGDSLSCSWDFGDGENGTGCSATHVYSEAGTYTATLTVNDGRGGEDEDTAIITITTADSVDINPGPYSDQLVVNEFLPNPEGLDNDLEFIEIRNLGNLDVNLSGWKIDDEEGGSSPYEIPDGTNISSGGYLVFYRSDTGISINNSGDSVRLLSPDKNIVSEQRYEGSAKDNESYARDDSGNFQWTTTLTPGEENIINAPAEEEIVNDTTRSSSSSNTSNSKSANETEQVNLISISQAKSQDKNTEVKVRGVVTVPPNIINATYFYIQDDTAGVQIYFSKKEFPNLKLGDQVEVSGKISERSGEKKINISEKSDIKVISPGASIDPAGIKTGDVKENFEGSLVRVSGQITKQSGNTFYIDDGSGEIKIYIQKSTNIDKPDWEKGDWVTITGIVGQTSTGYRVMPRYQKDLQTGKNVIAEGEIPAAGIDWKVLIISIILISSPLLIIRKNKGDEKS